ncbi:hypothetical protein ACHAPT_002387 [Fusarium lateritium]
MRSIDTLPNEIILEIAHLLPLSQQANLGRTCKRINALTEPLIWTAVELHREGYHETREEIRDPLPFRPPSDRAYLSGGRNPWLSPPDMLFKGLQHLLESDQDRLEKVAGRVKSLCTVVTPNCKIWVLLPYFSNLEALELHGRWDEVDEVTPEIVHTPLGKLRFAKLLGYLPRAGARWVLRSGLTLERLELGILDRPIQPVNYDGSWPLAPLPEENLADDDESSYYGSLSCEQTHPRPLGGFLPDEGVSVPNLRHLYLCASAHRDDIEYAQRVGWSSRAEEASSADWMSILMACRRTLQTLVLDHRPTVPDIETESWGEEDCMRSCHKLNDGAGSSTLVQVLEAVGIHKAEEFPELRDVYFYGVVVSKELDKRPSEERPAGRLMQQLEQRNVGCEARRGKWFTFEESERWTNCAL